MNKCVYCKQIINDERAVSVCDGCGHRVWGEKMFNAIKQNMDNAKQKGDLNQGSVCADLKGNVKSCEEKGALRLI
jgi:uncharacterized UBP type Zn finger protein